MASAAVSAPTFDLQSHSTHSDGELAPGEVVAAAAAAGVRLLALTDHDSLAGVAAAREAAREHDLTLLSAVEISVLDGAGQDLHLLGYRVDPQDRALNELLALSRGDREARAARMVDRLRELGWQVDAERLAARSRAGLTVGRPHLAEVVLAHPDNAERLRAEGITDPTAFLVAYLIEGTPAFVPRNAPNIDFAIDAIHRAGGLAVWAHPFFDIDAAPRVLETLERFRGYGLDGVEAFYVTHTREQTQLVHRRATELGLLTTGSADFHGPGHSTFHAFRAFSTYGLDVHLGPLAEPG